MQKVAKNWRYAATLMLAARCGAQGEAYKLLMLERSAKSKFMPSAYVFPGGVSAAVDFKSKWNDVLSENNLDIERLLKLQKTDKRPSVYTDHENLGLPPEIAFRLCALRETFEEAGILLLTDKEGKITVLDDPSEIIGGKYGTLQEWRNEVNKNADHFLDLMRFLNCSPAVASLYDWSTWLTPAFARTKRFDTMFYMCFIDGIPVHGKDCGDEVTETQWCEPDLIFTDYSIKLQPPQVFELMRMSRYRSFHELKAFAEQREQQGLEMFCTSQILLLDGAVVTIPGDDFHNDDVNAEPSILNITLEELRRQTKHYNRYERKGDEVTIRDNTGWCGHPPLQLIEKIKM